MDHKKLIQDLLDRSLALVRDDPPQFDHWRSQLLPNWVGDLLSTLDSDDLIAFIRDHHEYSFVYYDAFGKVCGKPRELAAHLLIELIQELVEEKR